MKKRKKIISLACFILIATMLVACNSAANESSDGTKNELDYPKHDINGTIPWGEGGPTDLLARSISPAVKEPLGASIVLTNRKGATGAIGAQYVYDQKSDGYSLLYAAENPALYRVLGISERSFEDFYPLKIFGENIQIISVPSDSPFKTIEELLAYAKKHPKKVKLAVTGNGGAPHIVSSIISEVSNIEFNSIPYDGDGPAMTAMLGGHIDVTITAILAANEFEKNGDIRILAVFNPDGSSFLPGVPGIGSIEPAYNKYFPWASFIGVWVKRDTPKEIIEKLEESFKVAYESEEFQKQMELLQVEPLGLSGQEADEYIKHFESVTTWILHDVGETSVSPKEFNIPRVSE